MVELKSDKKQEILEWKIEQTLKILDKYGGYNPVEALGFCEILKFKITETFALIRIREKLAAEQLLQKTMFRKDE